MKDKYKKGSSMECEFPTVNCTSEETIDLLKKIKTIAVMGLSPDESKPSFYVSEYMQKQGYKIYPVYPKGDEILGEKVYRSLSEIPDKIDCVNIFRKPAAVAPIVDETLRRSDVKVIWTQVGIVNNSASQKAKDAGLDVVQNRCLMVEHRAMKG